jgi:hypothetical protein
MTTSRKKILAASVVLPLLVFAFVLLPATARANGGGGGGNEYQAIVSHLRTKYRAKKVKIPFLWLARFAVRVVRPAGVKSFSVTMFRDLQFSRESLDAEMRGAMSSSLGAEWSPVFRARAREGQQAYMYMREAGGAVKLMLVTIDKNQAAVIRAKFSPEKLAEFINDPKIFGISLGENQQLPPNGETDKDKDADEDKESPAEKTKSGGN